MYKTLKKSLFIESTVIKNHILHSFFKLPFFKNKERINYSEKGFLNRLAYTLSFLAIILKEIIPKFLYILLCIQLPFSLYKIGNPVRLFTGQLFTLTLAGLIKNNNCPNGTALSKLMIRDMHLNPGRFTVAEIVRDLFFNFVGLFAASMLLLNTGFLNTLIVTAGIVSGRLINITYRMETFKMGCKDRSLMENCFSIIMIILTYIPPAFGYCMPVKFAVIGYITLIIFGISSIPAIRQYDQFREFENSEQERKNIDKPHSYHHVRKKLEKRTKRKKQNGFKGLHILFTERYSYVFIKPTLVTSAVIIGLTIVSFILFHFQVPMLAPKIVAFLTISPGHLIVPALLSGRGEKYCRTLYTGFDRSMLHYSFMKERKNILSLFLMRLKTLISINLISGLAFTVSLEFLLFLAGKFSFEIAFSLFLITVSCTVFISIHRILMYFLIMPYKYTPEGEKPGYGYSITENLFLLIFLVFLDPKTTSINLALSATVITAIYFIIAILLIYFKGQKTFKTNN